MFIWINYFLIKMKKHKVRIDDSDQFTWVVPDKDIEKVYDLMSEIGYQE